MKDHRTELQNFLETGVLGSCDYAQSAVQPEQDGQVTTRPCDWNNTTVAKTPEDEIYLGHTISLRYTPRPTRTKRRLSGRNRNGCGSRTTMSR